MSEKGMTYQRIIGYLKGLLSNRERHELELEVMRDAFEEEAFEGLNQLTGLELESDMRHMEAMLDKRTRRSGRKIGPVLFRIAAGILLVTGLGTVLYMVVFNGSKVPDIGYVAESRETAQPAEESEDRAGRGDDVSAGQTAPSVMPKELPLNETSQQPLQEVPEQMMSDDEMADSQAGIEEAQRYAMAPESTSTEATQQLRATSARTPSENAPMAEMKPDIAVQSPGERETRQVLSPLNSYTARVVDQTGNPVSGVAVYEKGVIKGAVTDMNGIFSMDMTQPSSLMALSSVSFREADLAGPDLDAGTVRQGEETLSLKEVVFARGLQDKKSLTGNAPEGPPSVIPHNPDALTTLEVSSPVPPGGSLRAFKRMVEENLDTGKLAESVEKMEEITGRYWIDVTVTILVDGSVGDMQFDTTIPQAVTASYRESIESLPHWQPALQGNTPVETQVEMRFVLSIE